MEPPLVRSVERMSITNKRCTNPKKRNTQKTQTTAVSLCLLRICRSHWEQGGRSATVCVCGGLRGVGGYGLRINVSGVLRPFRSKNGMPAYLIRYCRACFVKIIAIVILTARAVHGLDREKANMACWMHTGPSYISTQRCAMIPLHTGTPEHQNTRTPPPRWVKK